MKCCFFLYFFKFQNTICDCHFLKKKLNFYSNLFKSTKIVVRKIGQVSNYKHGKYGEFGNAL